MKQLGFGVFVIGIIIAVLGGTKVPTEQGGWPTTWWVFCIGAAVAVVGLIVWHKQTRAAAQEEIERSSGEGLDPKSILLGIRNPLNEFADRIEGMSAEQITATVDDLLTNHVLPFAQIRQQLVDTMGMEKGAEVLVTVAFAERLLNRVWSAAADGHLPEARKCFPEAYDAFNEAFVMVA